MRDITAHVNFGLLRDLSIGRGFDVVFEGTFAQWAASVWSESELSERWSGADLRWRLQWKHLLVLFGEAFRVLIARRTS